MIEDYLVQFCDITVEAPTGQLPAQDALGGADRTAPWPVVAQGVPCLYRPGASSLQARTARRDDARRSVNTGKVYFSASTLGQIPGGLTSRMRITITQAIDSGALGVYAVTGSIDPNTMGHHLEVDVERVRTP
jgi:hypothetical protein